MRKLLLLTLMGICGIAFSQCNISFYLANSNNIALSQLSNSCPSLGTEIPYDVHLITSGTAGIQNLYYTFEFNNGSTTTTTSSTNNTFTIPSSVNHTLTVTLSSGPLQIATCKTSKTYTRVAFVNNTVLEKNDTSLFVTINNPFLGRYNFNGMKYYYSWYKNDVPINELGINSTYLKLANNSNDIGEYRVNVTAQENPIGGNCVLRSNPFVIDEITSTESTLSPAEKTLLKIYNLQGQEITEDTQGIQIRVFSDGSREKTFVAP
jgi:hypothetical protein